MISAPACTANFAKASTRFFNFLKMPAGIAIFFAVLLTSFVLPVSAQTGDWVWSGGNNTLLPGPYNYLGHPGVYGTLGMPAEGNVPGARSAASSWTDSSGNLWLFGGNGLDANGTGSYLNDLWEFTPSTGEWAWVAGSSTVAGYLKPRAGVYGTLGVAAAGNAPGGREGAVIWTDHNGNFWLFGGFGTDSAGVVSSELNDLWQFSPATNEWAWMGGASTFGTSETYQGVYGTSGVPAASNLPGSRDNSASWTDANGNLWLFGGYGEGPSIGTLGELNDLWEFNPSTLQWTWMGGSTGRNTLGVYGTLGAASAANCPGGRHGGATWTDSSGNLWLFGGEGFDSATPSVDGYLNDLWEFNVSTNEWTWMGGSNVLDNVGGQPGIYGALGSAAPGNVPGSREGAAAWIDNGGNFWLFGGEGFDSIAYNNPVQNNAALNDLWEYIPAENEWIWQGGSKTSRSGDWNCTPVCGQPGVYGTLDIPASGNIPGSRISAAGWVDSSGNFWLFGGTGYDAAGHYAGLNDLWEYLTPPSTPLQAAATPNFSVAAGTYATAQTVTITDATAGAAIYYTTNGATPTTGSSQYAGPISVSSSETLKAIATASGFSSSSVATAFYTIVQAPTITWATPAAITYGTALSAAQLNATASVAGTFTYSPSLGAELPAGTQTLSVSFTPTDTVDYSTTTSTVTLVVNQASPTISWPAPSAITYGTALSATQLNASSGTAGAFTYSPAIGATLGAGTQTLTVTFTPTDTVDYSSATATVTLTVNKAIPAITWPAPAAVTYGTALNATQLNATSTVAGSFAYSPASGATLTAGSQTLSVTFTPTDTVDYAAATATVLLTVNQATPTLTWSAPGAITYGTALSATQLNASSTVPGTFTYSPAAGATLTAGAQTLTVTFTPTDTVDYTTATATTLLTVNKATPVVAWSAPAAITYGTPLSAAQLNASSPTAGTFAFSPAAGTVLTAGTQLLTATFTPTDTVDYTAATSTVTLSVNQATPSLSWASPTITYGTALSAAQFNASSTVAGTFTYSPAVGTVLTAGTHTVTITFTPTDTVDYATATATATVTVSQATPSLSWSTPQPIPYGTALAATLFNASSPTAGAFTYSPALGTVLNAGTHTVTLTFTPSDTVDYTTATATATVTVTQATPPLSWSTPAAISYGTALSGAQLDATSTVAGTFSYSPAAGVVLGAGTQLLNVVFTPSDTVDYSTSTASVSIAVNAATPAITWPTPAAISYGTALSSTQLDASSTVPGTFAYSPALGSVPNAGAQTLTVTFTPTNTTNYTSATASVILNVNQTAPTLTWPTPAAITYGTALSGTQLNATSNVAGTFTYSPAIGSVLSVGTQTLTVTFTPTNTTDYTGATATVALTVNKAAPVITWATPSAIAYGTALSATQLDATSSVAGTFTYSPASGTVLAPGTQTLSVTFTPTNTTDYTTATSTEVLTVNKATPTITWATPAAITQGTALSATQLDATASVAGTFAYSPASGTVLAAGSQTLTATFTPTNTTDYTTATDSVVLTVNPAPSFTLAASPASLSIAQGASGTSTITLTPKNGFSSSATLTATGMPTGVTASFSTNPTTGTSVLTLTASSTATVGTATVTITGTSGSLTASTTVALTVTAKSGFACHIVYSITSQWPGGFGTAITINNTGTAAISNWTLTFAFANGQTVTQIWNGNETQSGSNVTITNMSYNGSIPAGGNYNAMGFNGSWNNVTNAVPASFAVNGTVCK